MSRIAVLGATSQIARDLILGWGKQSEICLDLFARRPEAALEWLDRQAIVAPINACGYEAFGANDRRYDAIINFVGVGDPARAATLGASILEITLRFDRLALDYQDRFPECRYLFLSSGAVYGCNFAEPANGATPARFAVNGITPQEYYGSAKFYSEVCHRARPERPIIDIRVFNIFSRTQDLNARFFMTDLVRAIRDNSTLCVGADQMVRDYLHPTDFQRLIEVLLAAPPANTPVDCYSRAPVDKLSLLQAMGEWFGLRWEIAATAGTVNATGTKPNYYSTNTSAADFGYEPRYTSLEGLRLEVEAALAGGTPT